MKQEPASSKPEGEIVLDWIEFGHHFQIEKLVEPRMVGAHMRHFRLWHNGNPSWGGQWHHRIESARERAEYVLLGDYSARISWLENRVGALESEIAQLRAGTYVEPKNHHQPGTKQWVGALSHDA